MVETAGNHVMCYLRGQVRECGHRERPPCFPVMNLFSAGHSALTLNPTLYLPARASEQGNVIRLVSMSSKKNCN